MCGPSLFSLTIATAYPCSHTQRLLRQAPKIYRSNLRHLVHCLHAWLRRSAADPDGSRVIDLDTIVALVPDHDPRSVRKWVGMILGANILTCHQVGMDLDVFERHTPVMAPPTELAALGVGSPQQRDASRANLQQGCFGNSTAEPPQTQHNAVSISLTIGLQPQREHRHNVTAEQAQPDPRRPAPVLSEEQMQQVADDIDVADAGAKARHQSASDDMQPAADDYTAQLRQHGIDPDAPQDADEQVADKPQTDDAAGADDDVRAAKRLRLSQKPPRARPANPQPVNEHFCEQAVAKLAPHHPAPHRYSKWVQRHLKADDIDMDLAEYMLRDTVRQAKAGNATYPMAYFFGGVRDQRRRQRIAAGDSSG